MIENIGVIVGWVGLIASAFGGIVLGIRALIRGPKEDRVLEMDLQERESAYADKVIKRFEERLERAEQRAERAEQRAAAERTRDAFQAKLDAAGYGSITTEIAEAGPFYYAENYHQQYLAKNPNGYCNHRIRFTEWPALD